MIKLKNILNEDFSQRAANFRVNLRMRMKDVKKGGKIKVQKMTFTKVGTDKWNWNGKQLWNTEAVVKQIKLAVVKDIMKWKHGASGAPMVKAFVVFEGKLNEANFYISSKKGLLKSSGSNWKKPQVFRSYKDAEKYISGEKAYWVSDDKGNKVNKYGEVDEGLTEGRPIPMDTPNEFAYLEFKKFAYKHRGQYKKDMLKHNGDSGKMFKTASAWWFKWAYKNNKNFTHIKDDQKFGRALIVMMVDDNLIFDKKAWKKDNRITHVKEGGKGSGRKKSSKRPKIDMDRVFMKGRTKKRTTDEGNIKLSEIITIPIEIGDVVMGGKFKNKKITVKEIGTNEKGDITINGKSILRVRVIPKDDSTLKK